MFSKKLDEPVFLRGVPQKRQILLADANIPYKFSLDRKHNRLFFCINAEELTDQSFQSVVLELDTKASYVIPGLRNGFASTVDQATGTTYLGGSQGIYRFNPSKRDVEKQPYLDGVDVFDMYYKNDLYYVDTANQNLFVYRNNKKIAVPEVKEYLIHHFIIDESDDIFFVNASNLFLLRKGAKAPTLFNNRSLNCRGITTDNYGTPHLMLEDGIYSVDKKHSQLTKILAINNGYGVAFDRHNDIIYSDDRSIIKLNPFPSK